MAGYKYEVEIEVRDDDDDEIVVVCLTYDYHPGCSGDRWTPGEDDSVEITEVAFSDGSPIPEEYIFGPYPWALSEDAVLEAILSEATTYAEDTAGEYAVEQYLSSQEVW